MAFKGRPPIQVDFADLKATLNKANIQRENPTLYQTILQLIDKSQQNKAAIYSVFEQFFGDIIINDDVDLSAILALIAEINNILDFGTFWTQTDMSVQLPQSKMAVEGTGIDLDYITNPGQVIISATGAGGYIPLATGTEPLTFMSDGNGQPFLIPFTP